MSVITDCPYICAPNIMDTPDYTTKTVTLDMTDQTVIKAGTPISAEGKVANDETAIGILLDDCHACLGARRGLVVISGRVKQDVAANHSGVTISDEAKSAMINITFTGDGARCGGVKEDLILTLDGSSLRSSKTYNELYALYGDKVLDHINVRIKSSSSSTEYFPFYCSQGGGSLTIRYAVAQYTGALYKFTVYSASLIGSSTVFTLEQWFKGTSSL